MPQEEIEKRGVLLIGAGSIIGDWPIFLISI